MNTIKKAQAALEFFMTYGWVILIIIVVIGALIFFGAIRVPIAEKCIFPTGTGLYCDKFTINAGSDIILKIKNSLSDRINISGASDISYSGNSCVLTESTAIDVDSSGVLVFSGANCPELVKSGRKIKAIISIQFSDPSGFAKEAVGTLIAKIS